MYRPKLGSTEVARVIEKLWTQEESRSGDRLTLKELATRIGMNQPTLYRIYTGEIMDPKTTTIIPIAKYFDVSLNELRGQALIKNIGQPSAKSRFLAQKIDSLPSDAQKCINNLVDLLIQQYQSKTG